MKPIVFLRMGSITSLQNQQILEQGYLPIHYRGETVPCVAEPVGPEWIEILESLRATLDAPLWEDSPVLNKVDELLARHKSR